VPAHLTILAPDPFSNTAEVAKEGQRAGWWVLQRGEPGCDLWTVDCGHHRRVAFTHFSLLTKITVCSRLTAVTFAPAFLCCLFSATAFAPDGLLINSRVYPQRRRTSHLSSPPRPLTTTALCAALNPPSPELSPTLPLSDTPRDNVAVLLVAARLSSLAESEQQRPPAASPSRPSTARSPPTSILPVRLAIRSPLAFAFTVAGPVPQWQYKRT
jgi:hypothetical protein